MRWNKNKRLLAFLLVMALMLQVPFTGKNVYLANAAGQSAGEADVAAALVDYENTASSFEQPSTEITTTTPAVTTQVPITTTEQVLIKDRAYQLAYSACTSKSITLNWNSLQQNAAGYYIYRKCKYDTKYVKIADVAAVSGSRQTYKDETFQYGISFKYKVTPYHVLADGSITTGSVSNVLTVKQAFSKPSITKVSRKGDTLTITWKKAAGAKGYEIYRSASKGFKLVKTVKSNKNTITLKKISAKSDVILKIRAYTTYKGKQVYGGYGATMTAYSTTNQSVIDKIQKLKKKYPSYKYWNHMGKTSFSSTTVTNIPCNHNLYGMRYCNYYNCPNNILGLQCYGFAWKMSDLIYGKDAKIKNHKSFAKAEVGDVIRYNEHSVIIIEKHSNYIIAGECNIGDTCMILWGRKITKSELSGATYSHRYY